MGTEVLRPHNSLTQAPAIFHHRKSYYGYGNGLPKVKSSHRKPANRPENRRKSPEPKRSVTEDDLRSKQANNGLVLGQVTILRRGESLDKKIKASQKKSSEEITVYGTGRLGPDPKMVRKQVRFGLPDIYAGSAFSMSPAPSSLPLPSFFNKKEGGEKAVDDSATKDLRRLLRLD